MRIAVGKYNSIPVTDVIDGAIFAYDAEEFVPRRYEFAAWRCTLITTRS